MDAKFSRRRMIALIGMGLGTAGLAACGATPAPATPTTAAVVEATAAPATEATSAPVAEPTVALTEAPTAAAATSGGEPITLELVYHFWPGWQEAVTQISEKFTALYPNVTINFLATEWGQLKTVLTPRFAAKEPPDLVIADGQWPWTQQGQMLDLAPFGERDQIDFSLVADLKGGQVITDPDHTQYGLPVYLVGAVIAYNKGMLDKYGIDYPKPGWMIEDFGNAVRTLTRDVNDKSPNDADFDAENVAVQGLAFWGGQMWDEFIHAFGASLWSEDWMTCTLDDPKSVECFQFFNDLACKDKAILGPQPTTQASPADPFVSQRVAMTLDGDWMFSLWQSIEDFDWDVASTPAGPGGQFTYGASNTIGIPKDAKHPDESWEFIKYLLFDKEIQLIVGTSLSPALAEAAASEEFLALKQGKRGPNLENARWAFNNIHQYTVADWYNQTNRSQEWQPIFGDMSMSVLTLCDQEVEPLLKDTALQITEILQKTE